MPELTHVVLDANAVGIDPPLGKVGHGVLLDAHRAGSIVLVVPRLALFEAVNVWSGRLRETHAKLTNQARTLAKLDPSLRVSVPAVDRQERMRSLLARCTASLEAAGVAMPETPGVAHDALIERAVTRRQPFDDGGSGYRDALLWEVVRGIAGAGHAVILVSNDKKAFTQGRKEGAPLAEVLAEEIAAPGTVRLCRFVEDVVDELDLVAPEALVGARRIIDRLGPGFAESLRSELVERLSMVVHKWQVRGVINPFILTGKLASLGVAYDALGLEVEEARQEEDGLIEASVALTVRQFVSARVPLAVVDDVFPRASGMAYVDRESADVEIRARVVHRIRLVLDPIADAVRDAEPVEVLDVSPLDGAPGGGSPSDESGARAPS